MRTVARIGAASAAMVLLSVLPACTHTQGTELSRRGDEIVICGRLFHTGAPVVLWTDPGGYDGYRVEKRFVPWEKAAWDAGASGNAQGAKKETAAQQEAGGSEKKAAEQTPGSESRATQARRATQESRGTPNRYGLRFAEAGRGAAGGGERLSDSDLERFRGGGWDLASLQRIVDQFVIHYDAAGTSRQCFRILHDVRGLSVHFMLDIDGTIYQTLDVKERAWHATTSNDRSVGIEIANIGAYPLNAAGPLERWYAPVPDPQAERAPTRERGGWRWHAPAPDPQGRFPGTHVERTILTIPAEYAGGGVRTPHFTGSPIRPEPVTGVIQGRRLTQYDLTPEQYDSLIKLTATLCTVLPNIECNYPRDARGDPVTEKLPDDRLSDYRGLLGHYHIQKDKADPGPAFQWERVVSGARALMPRAR